MAGRGMAGRGMAGRGMAGRGMAGRSMARRSMAADRLQVNLTQIKHQCCQLYAPRSILFFDSLRQSICYNGPLDCFVCSPQAYRSYICIWLADMCYIRGHR